MKELNRRTFVGGWLAAGMTARSYGRVLGANDRISVGVIGCGARNLLGQALKFRAECNAEVRAVCDTWRQMREKAVEAVKAAGGDSPEQYVHYQDLLARKDIDAVTIGTPDHGHCLQLRDAARAGKDAYVEKPLAMDFKELNEAVEAVRKNNRITQMGTQVRSGQGAMAARAFLQAGNLGKILKIEQSRNGYEPYWYRYGRRPVTESDVDWKQFLMHRKYRPFDADQYAGWYGYREFSHGPHTNLMVHFIDTVHFITGAKYPRRVIAMGGIYRWKDAHTCPDSVEVVLDYPEEGFLARYCTVYGNSGNRFFRVMGTRGMLDLTNWSQLPLVSGEGSGEPDKLGPDAAVPPVETVDHMKNFLDCVRSRQTPQAPIDAGYGHSVAVLMADESFARGARMVHDPVKRSIQVG